MEASILRGEWGCEILVNNFCSEFWTFFVSPSLCSNCMSLVYFIHFLHAFVLCVLFLPVIYFFMYIIHPNFASFFQNNCIFRKLRYSLKFWNLKDVACPFLCQNSKVKCWKKLSFWNYLNNKLFTEEIQKMYIFNHYEKMQM